MSIKKWRCLLFLVVCMLSLTSCGKDDQGDVSYVDTETHILNIPDSYVDTMDVNGVKVEMNIEGVEYPENTDFKEAVYQTISYTDAQKQAIVEAVFDKDKGIYESLLEIDYRNMCKEDLQTVKGYEEKKKEYFLAEEGNSIGVSGCDEKLAEIDACLASASEERTKITDYSGNKFVGYIGDSLFLLTFVEKNGCLQEIKLSNYLGDAGVYMYRPSTEGAYAFQVFLENGFETEAKLQRENKENGVEMENACTKDIDTARDEAIAFLEACDIADVDLAEEYSLGWNYWGTDIQTEYDGYCFQFTRTVGSSRTFLASMELFTMDWKYTSEYFTVCVDDNGVVNAELQYRGNKIEETDITLKNFDEITDVLAERCSTFYNGHPELQLPAAFNFMQLQYMLVWDSDNVDTYSYKPVWLIAYYDELDYCYAYNDFYFSSALIILDAETGEIVDYQAIPPIERTE